MEKKTEKIRGVPIAHGKTVLPLAHHVGGRTVARVSVQARFPGGRWRAINAYLDSGAHTSVLTTATLNLLGGKSVTGAGVTLTDTVGKRIACSLIPIEVKVRRFLVPLMVAVSKEYHPRVNILGIDFFERFRITFDVARRRVTLQV